MGVGACEDEEAVERKTLERKHGKVRGTGDVNDRGGDFMRTLKVVDRLGRVGKF